MHLHSNILSDDSNLNIRGYNFVRSNHPSNQKLEGVCILQELFASKNRLYQLCKRVSRIELMVCDTFRDFLASCRSPSQSQNLFESFKESLELNLESTVQNNPFLVVLLRDYNVKSSNCCNNYITTTEGKTIENISSQFALHQITNDPTQILKSSSWCIILIFTSQTNLITESGLHLSLHPNSHHQIIFTKFNLEIHCPPTYFLDAWHYQDANTKLMRRAIDVFDWDRAFVNANLNEKVFILKKMFWIFFLTLFHMKHWPLMIKTPLVYKKIIMKNIIQEKNNVYKSYRNNKSNNNTHYLMRFNVLQEDLQNADEVSKLNYYSRITYKVTHIQNNTKVYWTFL